MSLVGIGTLPTPFSPTSVPLPPETGGRGHTSLRVGGWGESQFRRGAYTLVLFICTYFVMYTDSVHLHAFHSYKVHGPFLRKIRLIESNTKYRYIKKLTCKGTLRQVFYLSEDPFPPMTPYSPLSNCIRVRIQYT